MDVNATSESAHASECLGNNCPANDPSAFTPPHPDSIDVASVFDIPMTQSKILQELPSQMDFDLTESEAMPHLPETNKNLCAAFNATDCAEDMKISSQEQGECSTRSLHVEMVGTPTSPIH